MSKFCPDTNIPVILFITTVNHPNRYIFCIKPNEVTSMATCLACYSTYSLHLA